MCKTIYALETKLGPLQVTKGTYLSFLQRAQKQQKIKDSAKVYQTQESLVQRCCSIKTVRISKQTHKSTTVKKCRQTLYNKLALKTKTKFNKAHNSSFGKSPHSESQVVRLYYKNNSHEFRMFEDRLLFPKDVSSFQIPMCFDNDCDSDEEQVGLAVNNLIMSLSLAIYDNKYHSRLC